jgi:anti-sigma regulatory factor (Ser/Thr protein kinase)
MQRHSSTSDERAELDALRGECARQSVRIAALEDEATRQRARCRELVRENDDLTRRVQSSSADRRLVELALSADRTAPRVARGLVARTLTSETSPGIVRDAQLTISELVTNGVRHGGARSSDSIVVRIARNRDSVRMEVVDPGRGGILAGAADTPASGHFGLHLVSAVSQRWGVEWASSAGTRVWAQFATHPQNER